jgi:hypothetical protein
MAKPETVRRVKTYSAASGYVYQYQFQDVKPARRGPIAGNEYVYYVSADRKRMFPIKILVDRASLDSWMKKTGRALTGTEEYAVAKMRLFQAFDEIEDPATLDPSKPAQPASQSKPELLVNEANLSELLERLDL